MWVDIFPKDDGTCKPPVVIDERKPVKWVKLVPGVLFSFQIRNTVPEMVKIAEKSI